MQQPSDERGLAKSSTEPAVACEVKRCPSDFPSLSSPQLRSVAGSFDHQKYLPLAVFHTGLGDPVVGAGCRAPVSRDTAVSAITSVVPANDSTPAPVP